MKTRELTVARVGNSRGVRLPADVLRRYQIRDTLIMEQRPDEIALRPKRTRRHKLTWAENYQQMAESDEDWSDWESLPEGLTTMRGETAMKTIRCGPSDLPMSCSKRAKTASGFGTKQECLCHFLCSLPTILQR